MDARILLLCLFSLVLSSPVEREKDPYSHDNLQKRLKKVQDSLEEGQNGDGNDEYARYLKEVVANNPELAKQLKDLPPDLVAKRFGKPYGQKNGNVRTQIEELERMNLEKIRRVRNELADNRGARNGGGAASFQKRPSPEEAREKMEEYRRIQEELDSIRKQQFESFEKRVEDVRKKKLKEMDETQRLKEEQRLEELAKEHKDHQKMQHPASKKQLEDIWEHQDGLKDEPFDPKTFFYLHDKDSNGALDFYEIEALFMNEIKKVYGDEYNNMVVEEELAEMREHVFKEVDRDHDGFVSLNEFLIYSNNEDFNKDEEWKPLEERDDIVLTKEDMDLAYDEYDYHYDQQHPEQEGGEHHQPVEETLERHEAMPVDIEAVRGQAHQPSNDQGPGNPTPEPQQQGDDGQQEKQLNVEIKEGDKGNEKKEDSEDKLPANDHVVGDQNQHQAAAPQQGNL